MADWLMKTEPDVFGIDDLERKRVEHWDGVRSYQARNHMRAMQVGDRVLFYHSSADPPGVAGLARICRAAYPDFTSWNPQSKYYDPKSTPELSRWSMVDVEFVEKFPRLVPLDVLRQTRGLEDMLLLRRGMRLSVQPVTPAQFDVICQTARRAR
ncbi:MAG TPA: EVE domain-containing protein [Kofleriaceae bacterium]|nr:EVE domain-containing protein [Kofleriaceae bacterium]